MARAYWGPYAASKAALEALVRTYAAETATTQCARQSVRPGPTRTRMRATALPGEDPETLPTPADVAKTIVPLCLPECMESGKSTNSAPASFWNFGRRRNIPRRSRGPPNYLARRNFGALASIAVPKT